MAEGTVTPPILELLAWIASRPRTYAEAMEAWRSTCPRHTVWEDAWAGGLVEVVEAGGSMGDCILVLTGRGCALLDGKA